jgi:AraC-like DNA-binding protein
MSRPAREPASPNAIVPALLRHVAATGADAAELARRFGLPADAGERDEIDLTPATVDELLDAASVMLGEPALAIRLPGELPLRRYCLAELAARSAATVRDSLAAIARFGSFVDPRFAFELVDTGPVAVWHQRTPRHPRGVGRHSEDFVLAYVITHLRAATGHAVGPTQVWFAHARPRRLEPYHRFFATSALAFGEPSSGFELHRALLDLRVVTGDARTFATATNLAEAELQARPRSHELAPRVTAFLAGAMTATADDAARAMQMSARTLQRRLEAEGTTFSEVLDGAREQLARKLIADLRLGLAEIADRVGFADLATFTRAFKRWTGSPPGQFRRSL